MTLEPITILLVEDNPADVRLTQEVLAEQKLFNMLEVAADGVEAMDYLRRRGKYQGSRRPDLILLDLNLPRKDGREVLAEIKHDERLRTIPVVVLTASEAESDVVRSYHLHANCYITKPLDLSRFTEITRAISNFWFTIVKLPPKGED